LLKNSKASPVAVSKEGASIPNAIFKLVKALVCVGVLSFLTGVAIFFGDAPSAFLTATSILICVVVIFSA
jgi:hypothetical protein